MAGKYSIYNYSLLLSLVIATHCTFVAGATGRHPSGNSERTRLTVKDSLPSERSLGVRAYSPEENILHPGERIADKIRNNLFVKAEVTKTECFVGEPLVVTYKLYSRLDVKSSISRQPALNGFSKNELIKIISLKNSPELIQGKLFQVHVLRKTLLVPQVAGSLEIDPMEVEHKINFIRSGNEAMKTGGQLNDLLNRMKREEKATSSTEVINTHSKGLTVTVNELPALNKPPDFSGAVGSFTMQAKISSTNPVLHEFIGVVIEIKGKGDLSLIEPPHMQFPNQIEFSQVKLIPVTEKQQQGFYSSRMFEYLVIPRHLGYTSIPSVSFSYFDPLDKSYKKIKTMPITIQVQENSKKLQDKVAPKQKTSTIKIQADPIAKRKRSVFFLLGLLAISIAIFWKKALRFVRESLAGVMKGKLPDPAGKSIETPIFRAEERLKVVKEMTEAKDFTMFYYELNKTLWEVLTEKLRLLPTEFNKGTILSELRLRGWSPEDRWNLESTMNEYERNLYVPGYKDENDFEAAFHKAVAIISKLEQLPCEDEMVK
jgi:hypothetical protein